MGQVSNNVKSLGLSLFIFLKESGVAFLVTVTHVDVFSSMNNKIS